MPPMRLPRRSHAQAGPFVPYGPFHPFWEPGLATLSVTFVSFCLIPFPISVH